ncbi:MAG: helix-turn-helix domain-containing protein [Planctomycetes bacterium]|nr:helix-turn-helix domain-containing protein [Planctomycetota bacterium]
MLREPTSEPLLIQADELATLLNVSERTLWRLLSAGKIPEPVRLGRSTRWRLDQVRQWINDGCPDCTGDE